MSTPTPSAQTPAASVPPTTPRGATPWHIPAVALAAAAVVLAGAGAAGLTHPPQHGVTTMAVQSAAGLPACLEATPLRPVILYEHLGFVRTKATIRIPGGPALWPMWRDPTGFPRIDQHQDTDVRASASGTG